MERSIERTEVGRKTEDRKEWKSKGKMITGWRRGVEKVEGRRGEEGGGESRQELKREERVTNKKKE